MRSSAGALFDDGVVPRGADEFAVEIAVDDVDAVQFRRSAAQLGCLRLADGMQVALEEGVVGDGIVGQFRIAALALADVDVDLFRFHDPAEFRHIPQIDG